MAVRTIEWKNNRVVMLDQRLLPHQEIYRVYDDYREVAEAIRSMVIRGAPAIGVAAATPIARGALKTAAETVHRDFGRIVLELGKTCRAAVDLSCGVRR